MNCVFNQFLEELIQDFALGQLVFNLGNQSWIVQVNEDRTLESAGFATLCAALELQQHDYMHYGSNFMGPRSAAYRFPTG